MSEYSLNQELQHAVAKRREEFDAGNPLEESVGRLNLAKHMRKISGDPSGSELHRYLRKEDVETCEQFLGMATELQWPGSLAIDMRACRIPGVPAWTSGLRTAKAGLTKVLFYPKIDETRRGYYFGRLRMIPSQHVALCSDGYLRSLRGDELPKSYGIGWGVLPDPELLLAAIKPATVPIDYGSKSLGTRLVAQIPSGCLPPPPLN